MCDWDESIDVIDPSFQTGSIYQPEVKDQGNDFRDRRGYSRGRQGFRRNYHQEDRGFRNERNGQNFEYRGQPNYRQGRFSHRNSNYRDTKRSYNQEYESHDEDRDGSNWRSNRGRKIYDNSTYKPGFSPKDDDSELIDWGALMAKQEEEEKKRFAYLPNVVKKTYVECDQVKEISPAEADEIRRNKHEITVSRLDESLKCDAPNPVLEFSHAFEPYPHILEKIYAQKFVTPSPIQCQLWPLLMLGNDVVGIAQTGTGKTLAYLLPGFLHIEAQDYFKDPQRDGPLLLVLAPTRELAQQIYSEAVKFSYAGIRSVCVYGQGDYGQQCRAIRSGVEIVVATPGRLNDFVNKGIVNLEGVSYLILDEADRMLDMGFQPDILKITTNIRKDRQTVLTSATWPCDVEYIAKRLMTDAYKVHVGMLDLAAVGTVSQNVIVCEEDDKVDMLLDMLRNNLTPEDKVIVFSNKKAMVDHLSVILIENNIDSRVMHGGIEQSDRESALEDLKEGTCRVLIATDVASRGLDVSDLTLVINLDLPKNLEEYVHRSGRTGRAGRTGEVVSFVTWGNRGQAQELIEILERSNQTVPSELQRLAERAKRYESSDNRRGRFNHRGRGRGRRDDFYKWN